MTSTAIPLVTNLGTPAIPSLSTSSSAPPAAANTALPSFVSLLGSLLGDSEKPSSAEKPTRALGHPLTAADVSKKQDLVSNQPSLTIQTPSSQATQPVLLPVVLQVASLTSPPPPTAAPVNSTENDGLDPLAANSQPTSVQAAPPQLAAAQTPPSIVPAPKSRAMPQPTASNPDPAQPAPVYLSYNVSAPAQPIVVNLKPAQPAPISPSSSSPSSPSLSSPSSPSSTINAQPQGTLPDPAPAQRQPAAYPSYKGRALPQPTVSNPEPAQPPAALYSSDDTRAVPQAIVSSPQPVQHLATLFSSEDSRAAPQQILSVSAAATPQIPVASDVPKAAPKPALAFSAKITPTVSTAGTQAAATVSASPAPTPQVGEQSQDNGQDDPNFTPPKPVLKAPSKIEPTEADQIANTSAPLLTPPPSTDTAFAVLPHQALSSDAPTPTPAPTIATKADPAPVNQPSDERPAAAALPETNASSKSEPLRDLSLRIGTSPTNQVEVKVQERAGELHVAVLSSSSNLTTDLRQQVGDLVGKLDRAGYHAETFGPSASLSSKQSDSQFGTGQQQEPSDRQQPQNQQQNQGGRKRTNQPQWLQEMNTSFGPTAVEGVEN